MESKEQKNKEKRKSEDGIRDDHEGKKGKWTKEMNDTGEDDHGSIEKKRRNKGDHSEGRKLVDEIENKHEKESSNEEETQNDISDVEKIDSKEIDKNRNSNKIKFEKEQELKKHKLEKNKKGEEENED